MVGFDGRIKFSVNAARVFVERGSDLPGALAVLPCAGLLVTLALAVAWGAVPVAAQRLGIARAVGPMVTHQGVVDPANRHVAAVARARRVVRVEGSDVREIDALPGVVVVEGGTAIELGDSASRSTVAAQSQHSHSTVTAQAQQSNLTTAREKRM